MMNQLSMKFDEDHVIIVVAQHVPQKLNPRFRIILYYTTIQKIQPHKTAQDILNTFHFCIISVPFLFLSPFSGVDTIATPRSVRSRWIWSWRSRLFAWRIDVARRSQGWTPIRAVGDRKFTGNGGLIMGLSIAGWCSFPPPTNCNPLLTIQSWEKYGHLY